MKKVTILALTIILFSACKKDVSHSIKINFTSSANAASPALTCTLPGTPFAIANSGYFLNGTVNLSNINSQTSMGQDGFCNLSEAFILTTKTSGQIVATNGDKIYYSGDDLIDLNNAILHEGTTAAMTGLWTITGGTGKFVGASGSIPINGTVNLAAAGGPSFSITGEGTIIY